MPTKHHSENAGNVSPGHPFNPRGDALKDYREQVGKGFQSARNGVKYPMRR